MLYNIKALPLHRVFHGIRFKVKKIGCRDDNQFFYVPTFRLNKSHISTIYQYIPKQKSLYKRGFCFDKFILLSGCYH